MKANKIAGRSELSNISYLANLQHRLINKWYPARGEEAEPVKDFLEGRRRFWILAGGSPENLPPPWSSEQKKERRSRRTRWRKGNSCERGGGSVKLKICSSPSVLPSLYFSQDFHPAVLFLLSPSPDNGTYLPAGPAITWPLFLISSLGYLTQPLSCTGRRCAAFSLSLLSFSPALSLSSSHFVNTFWTFADAPAWIFNHIRNKEGARILPLCLPPAPSFPVDLHRQPWHLYLPQRTHSQTDNIQPRIIDGEHV